jgi:hypothetical protein
MENRQSNPKERGQTGCLILPLFYVYLAPGVPNKGLLGVLPEVLAANLRKTRFWFSNYEMQYTRPAFVHGWYMVKKLVST